MDKHNLYDIADQCWPDVTFGRDDIDERYQIKPTPEQCAALFRKWKRDDNGMTWRMFASTVVPFDYDAVGVYWCGMWLGIETDGYTHS